MSTEQSKQAWRFAGSSVLILLVLTIIFYQHTVLYIASLWNQIDIGEYAHGYLVLAISLYLVFTHKEKLSALSPHPEYRALLILLAASMIWMIAAMVDIEMLQAASFILIILAVAWTVLGNQAIRLLAFPILFIFFAIPIWFPLSPVLQNIAADAVFAIIRQLSIPAFRQDNMIVLPAGTLSIEEACSGLRYLLAALTLGTLYAYINFSSLRSRLIVVLIAACSAILANILRVFIVVYLGYSTDMQHPLVEDHLSLGWYLFAGLVVILLLVDSWLHKKYGINHPVEADTSADIKADTHSQNYPRYLSFVILTGLLMATAPAIVYQATSQGSNTSIEAIPQLPLEAGGWTKTLVNDDTWNPVYHGAVNLKQGYQKGNNMIVMYMGYYPVQTQGKELINDLNHINNKKIWRTVYPVAHTLVTDNNQILEQLLKRRSGQKRLIWYWYNVAGNATTNKYKAKLLQVLGLLTGKSWAYVIAVSIQTADNLDTNREILKDFILSVETPVKNEIDRLSIQQQR